MTGQPVAAKDAIVQMFSSKPKFDLAAFLAEKADPAQVKKFQQNRRWREKKQAAAPKANPVTTPDEI